ncbi:hypothetical protein GYMLUDRAFT_181663, partial [Collybiopsis luxurians FD-317 M1]
LHTDLTLASFEVATTRLGQPFQAFAKRTAEEFDTRPLPGEVAAATHRRAKQNSDGKGKSRAFNTDSPRKLFNISTYKFHALGDYPWTIRTFGTMF